MAKRPEIGKLADNFGKIAIKKIMVASSPVVWPVTVQFLAMIAKALELEGVSREDFLADSGLSPALLDAGEHYIPYTTTLQLLERARDLSGDPCFGMTLGKLQTPSGWGVLGYAINCCSTIGQALHVAMKYHRIATNISALRLERQGDTAFWVAEPPVPFGRLLPMVMEQEFLAFCRSVPALTGKTLPLQAAWFSYPTPAYAERYQQELGCPVHFDAADNRLAFDSAFLDCPMLQANPLTIAMAVRLCEQLMSAHPTSDPLSAHIRELLCANLSGFLDEEAVAARLNVTSRTLRNRLNRAGSSFQRIRNDVRAQLGKDLLSHTPIKIDDIAVRLGFSTARSFRRAFRHWTGQSPAEFRKSAASQGQLAHHSMAGGAADDRPRGSLRC